MLAIGTRVTDTHVSDLDKALLQQSQIFELHKPTDHLINCLVNQSNSNQHELKRFITEETTHDLVSLVSTPKGSIHKIIDKTAFLRYLFLKVCSIYWALLAFFSDSMSQEFETLVLF